MPPYTLFSESEIATLLRNRDWSNHPLGSMEQWPVIFMSHLNMILNSSVPMYLFWGKELYCFYNDAFRPSLGLKGKHPETLGQPAKVAWSEVWDVIEPMLSEVRTTGKSISKENLLIPLHRNGQLEEAYWTFTYSTIIESPDQLPNILITVAETTDAVINTGKLKDSRDQFAFAIEAAEMGTWELDVKNNTFEANDRFKEWFGLPLDQPFVFEEGLNSIIPSHRERVKEAFSNSLTYESGGKYETTYIIKPKKGKKRVLRAQGLTFFDENKQPYRVNGTVQDITDQFKIEKERKKSRKRLEAFSKQLEKEVEVRTMELKNANDKLKLSVDNLKKANESLQSFAYVSSHDLQEPLRKIQVFISRIAESKRIQELPKEFMYFERISSSADRMRVLIKDLLAFSKVSTITSKLEMVQLDNFLQQIFEEFKEEINHQKVKIDIDADVQILVIPYQIQQLFLNFLTNSLKFASNKRPLQISIKAEVTKAGSIDNLPETNYENFYKITFKDNGIGFLSEYNTYVFNVFKRLHTREQFPGSGIGLAIVKQIVNNHEGHVEAFGEEQKGATFITYLPVRKQLFMD